MADDDGPIMCENDHNPPRRAVAGWVLTDSQSAANLVYGCLACILAGVRQVVSENWPDGGVELVPVRRRAPTPAAGGG